MLAGRRPPSGITRDQAVENCNNCFIRHYRFLSGLRKSTPHQISCTKGKGLEGKGKYEEALDLFESVLDDPTWGNYARKQVERQENLILRKAAQEG